MYRGNKWYKCDFHLHTTSSLCFEDKKISAQQFVEKAVSEKLECIAITDHNSASGIDEIRTLAKEKGIIVFPGVEVTCSDAKIHLLILFDLDYPKEKIEDFLIKIHIERDLFGKQEAHSNLGIIEIAKKAEEENAVIIPAHIDDYAGITYVSNTKRKEFLNMSNIRAVQMVKDELVITDVHELNNDEFKNKIIKKYKDVSNDNVKDYISCTKNVKEKEKGIMTFSDNPNSEGSSKHGLWGIGKKYTWIKMDENPNLESLRQALLMPDKRIRNCIVSPYNPYEKPDFWIKSISVENLETINEKIEIEFSPQLNTIIGGRGSGKSTIVKLLTGIFGQGGIVGLTEIQQEFNRFFQLKNNKDLGRGVLKKDTLIEIEVERNGIKYKVIAYEFTSNSYKTIIKKYNTDICEYEEFEDDSRLDFFEIDIYNQKQIYEMAQNTNVLREKIDAVIGEIYIKNKEKEELESKYVNAFLTLQENKRKVQSKNKITLEMKDINEKIDLFNKSDITNILPEYRLFNDEYNILKGYLSNIQLEFSKLQSELNKLNIEAPNMNDVRNKYKDELTKFIHDRNQELNSSIQDVKNIVSNVINSKEIFNKEILKTSWYKDKKSNCEKYEKSLEVLEAKGVNVELINTLVNNLNSKKEEFDKLVKIESGITSEEYNLKKLKDNYNNMNDDIRELRNNYIKKLLENKNVKIEFLPLRDKTDFENKLRSILQKDKYEDDFNNICKNVYSGDVQKNLNILITDFKCIKNNDDTKFKYSTKFKNIIKELNDEQFARIELLLPEDELRVKYKPHGSSQYKLLVNASAGQRTSAILTFILTEGVSTLILDQPEDDLDNKLIYELIVERLLETKEKRQVIVVTHNANIPVNGDSEMIIAMNSTTNKIKINKVGTIENKAIKDEICDVMEGGETAFKMRSQKYGFV